MTETSSPQVSVASEASHDEHGNNTVLFLKVFGALCVLTALSFGIANSPLMKSHVMAWSSMMVVSCAKAFLVISFFMHLKWERAWKYVLTIPAILMSLFLVISLVPDIALRTEAYSQSRWLHASEPAAAAAELGVGESGGEASKTPAEESQVEGDANPAISTPAEAPE